MNKISVNGSNNLSSFSITDLFFEEYLENRQNLISKTISKNLYLY